MASCRTGKGFTTKMKGLVTKEKTSQDSLIKLDRMDWIPDQDMQLQLENIVGSHCGAAGRRGHEVTLDSTKSVVVWEKLAEDCQSFAAAWFHCISSRAGNKVPRPLAISVPA